MKIYHLIICYNDETEELEYIEERIEDASKPNALDYTDYDIELDADYWKDDELMELIWKEGLAEA